ncbi:PP2C family protein-serine/threonine phosphatase [Syntrophotalea acetylenica]|uniref:PPM-type phosphatase domain-containing protein n=1 Tax=Syntrophotalea acetylenica TaxID=29542 RepID=A0A1L3GD16_SYNAC|nr:SpoIIE family protein phosphatase [Syntrophotalea acetylenica]APG23826.1 hypothetical protein A7E75_01405 [Syntrophotalea acetylenica]APG44410.1 hypothetical protein A6070_10020 [Syntrophotalea acetylenica]
MPEKILLARKVTPTTDRLYRMLREKGYFILNASDLDETLHALRERPDLLMFDTEIAEKPRPEQWPPMIRFFREHPLPCLLFSSNGRHPIPVKPLAPWTTDSLRHPVDIREVEYKVASQLNLRRLTYERDLAQRLLLQKQKELDENRRSAAQIQRALLPTGQPAKANLDCAWSFIPCEKIGGDLFNIIPLTDDFLLIYLLDVSGHGVSAAMVTVSVFQSLSPSSGRLFKNPDTAGRGRQCLSPSAILAQLEREYPFERFGKFFTISCLLLHTPSGRLRYSSAGHPPPVCIRRAGSLELLASGGSIIGAGARVPFEEGEIILERGDRVFLYSDGIIEHADAQGDMFGPQRLYRKLQQQSKRRLAAACDQIIETLRTFGQKTPFRDDVTLLGIEFGGTGKP